MGNKKKQDKHKEKVLRNEDEQPEEIPQKQEETIQEEQQEEPKFEIIPPKKIQYCPICSFPLELCRYGKSPNECIKFLYDKAPNKVTKYHPDFKEEDIADIKKAIKQNKKEEELKEDKKEKPLKERYIVIDSKSRGKRKYVTTITALAVFGIDPKDFSKKLSKKFACSCSVVEEGAVQLQGDFFEEIKQILVGEYKVKKKYILDGEEYKAKFNEEMAKKKAAKKVKDGSIKQEENEDDRQEDKDVKAELKRLELKEKAEQEKAKFQQLMEEQAKTRMGFEIRSDSEDEG